MWETATAMPITIGMSRRSFRIHRSSPIQGRPWRVANSAQDAEISPRHQPNTSSTLLRPDAADLLALLAFPENYVSASSRVNLVIRADQIRNGLGNLLLLTIGMAP